MNKTSLYNHVYPVWLVNFYAPKRYLLHVKKVKTVKNIDMKTLIFLKFTFRGLLVYRDRWIWFYQHRKHLWSAWTVRTTDIWVCVIKMRLSTCVYNFRWEILKDAKTSGKYSHYLIAQLMYFSLHLCLYNLRGLT